MFKNLRASWLEAVENFKYELEKDSTLDSSQARTEKMQSKIQEAENLISRLKMEIEHCSTQTEKEIEEISNCKRRKQLALDIDDKETATIAQEYLLRHTRNSKIFKQKNLALQNELKMREEQLQFMLRMFQKAKLGETKTYASQSFDQ